MRKFWRKMRRRKNIDFRDDPAPTDWLARRTQKYAHIEMDIKTDGDYLDELINKLNGMRCEPVCANGNGNASSNASSRPADSRAPVSCICSLVEQLSDAEGELVPVGEFTAVVETTGYDHEQALAQYKHYATKRIGERYRPEFKRLYKEARNTYNWSTEFAFDEFGDDEDDPADKSHEIIEEAQALLNRIDREVEAAMSA